MGIKRSGARELRGESAVFWRLNSIQYVQIQPDVSSDLGNGSVWVDIRDAKLFHRCSWRSTRIWSHQLTSDLQSDNCFGKVCNGRVWKQFRCLRWFSKSCGAPPRLAVLVEVVNDHACLDIPTTLFQLETVLCLTKNGLEDMDGLLALYFSFTNMSWMDIRWHVPISTRLCARTHRDCCGGWFSFFTSFWKTSKKCFFETEKKFSIGTWTIKNVQNDVCHFEINFGEKILANFNVHTDFSC